MGNWFQISGKVNYAKKKVIYLLSFYDDAVFAILFFKIYRFIIISTVEIVLLNELKTNLVKGNKNIRLNSFLLQNFDAIFYSCKDLIFISLL